MLYQDSPSPVLRARSSSSGASTISRFAKGMRLSWRGSSSSSSTSTESLQPGDLLSSVGGPVPSFKVKRMNKVKLTMEFQDDRFRLLLAANHNAVIDEIMYAHVKSVRIPAMNKIEFECSVGPGQPPVLETFDTKDPKKIRQTFFDKVYKCLSKRHTDDRPDPGL
eukprot:TRINITY_DN328_c0_g1_i2.p1 TRINITY_DN328_c0_g1~~TRINITY_DN328_c0_g1_i2.p1  ORF type:complete len:165 (-),score=33.28 TRINITY_DN328_c0_g1_i2:47-541(-)